MHREHHLESVSRIEVLAGPSGKRRWSEAMKGRVVAASLVTGVSVRSVAERHGLKPNHVSSWRGLARAGKLVVPDFAGANFAAVVIADLLPPPAAQDRIELVVGGVILRMDASTPPARIAALVAALQAGL